MTLISRAALYYSAASFGGLAVALKAWRLGNAGVADAIVVAV